jgi:Ca2+-transporting ATPase
MTTDAEPERATATREDESAALRTGKDARPWHTMTAAVVLQSLDAAPEGFTPNDVAARQATFGRNELDQAAKEPRWRAFLRQYASFMQLLLLGAAVVSLLISEEATFVLLIGLTVLNAGLGLRQEAKASESVEALREMMQVRSRVRREGEIAEVDSRDLVPGDIVLVEAGDLVPADCRVIEAASLEIEESSLTGESHPASKSAQPIPAAEAPLGDRSSMAYMNTQVTRGSATLVVTATGMRTEMGRIASMLEAVEVEASPLQVQMNQLAKVFAYLAGATVALMVVAGAARGLDRSDLFLLAISVSLGAIPEGLPTVVTALLSIGTRQLAERNAVVKDLTSVETLGSTSAICSDKTGTLTLNKMSVRVIRVGAAEFTVEGLGYEETGTLRRPAGVEATVVEDALTGAALCSDATIHDGELIGDPTEGALLAAAARGGLDIAATRQERPRRFELPFDADYKLMATFHDWTVDGEPVIRAFVKGAPDVILARSAGVLTPGGIQTVEEARSMVEDTNRALASEGMRVLAVATRDFPAGDVGADEELLARIEGLTLDALFGIVDPPRREAKDAIEVARRAGVRVRMITGDHIVTAAAIAKELGIEGDALSGADLDRLSDEEFAARLPELGVFGRVAPEHKVRLVNALRDSGQIVAMTGDGVNDAPALKAADIGVAMGITGTEVSKQAARMVLLDDNFATIVESIRHGRGIYDNLLKYIRYQTAALVSFIALFVGATIFNIAEGAPLNPLQILWINFLITELLAIALGFDTPVSTLMQRPPRPAHAPVLDRGRALRVGLLGFVMGASALVVTALAPGEAALGKASVAGTMALVTLSLGHIVAALTNRDETRSIFRTDLLQNPRMLRAVLFTAGLTVLVTELGFLQRWLLTTELDARQWGICLLAAAVVLAVDEIRKAVERVRSRRSGASNGPGLISAAEDAQPVTS